TNKKVLNSDKKLQECDLIRTPVFFVIFADKKEIG
ncbi:MAG: hypothetical protein H6Q20_862, partial [Bacteroidetes bacterium]|nr:hypothetical protein [Bacteroidota bacterium]